jgi:hypothetical protein
MTHKLSQSHFRIQTRSQRHSEGPHPRPRRLTKTLQPSSQGLMGARQAHRGPDGAQVEGWCVYTRDTRQGPDRACFSFGVDPTLDRPVMITCRSRTGHLT